MNGRRGQRGEGARGEVTSVRRGARTMGVKGRVRLRGEGVRGQGGVLGVKSTMRCDAIYRP